MMLPQQNQLNKFKVTKKYKNRSDNSNWGRDQRGHFMTLIKDKTCKSLSEFLFWEVLRVRVPSMHKIISLVTYSLRNPCTLYLWKTQIADGQELQW